MTEPASSHDDHIITSADQLATIYGAVNPNSLTKEIDHVSAHYRAFIDHSPFVVISSVGPEGLDSSPRGDPAGFCRVADPKTVMLPDRLGNNRIDTLKNIVRDPRVSLLFLVPGVGETLRINGQATISVAPELCGSFAINGKAPRSVIVVAVERVYFQCQKALHRSRLWAADAQVPRDQLPTAGQIVEALSQEPFDGAAYDRNYPERLKQTIY